MNKFIRIAILFAVAAAAFANQACKGRTGHIVELDLGQGPVPLYETLYAPPPGVGLIDPVGFGFVFYAPFVEDVVFPESMVENVPFDIVVSDLPPENSTRRNVGI